MLLHLLLNGSFDRNGRPMVRSEKAVIGSFQRKETQDSAARCERSERLVTLQWFTASLHYLSCLLAFATTADSRIFIVSLSTSIPLELVGSIETVADLRSAGASSWHIHYGLRTTTNMGMGMGIFAVWVVAWTSGRYGDTYLFTSVPTNEWSSCNYTGNLMLYFKSNQ